MTVAESIPQPLPDVVLVELGVNDADAGVFAANAERILAAVGEADLVVWVTAHGPELAVPGVDCAIVAAMGATPNGAIVDWDRLVPPDALSSDGVHPDARTGGVARELRHAVPRVVDARRDRQGRDALRGRHRGGRVRAPSG